MSLITLFISVGLNIGLNISAVFAQGDLLYNIVLCRALRMSQPPKSTFDLRVQVILFLFYICFPDVSSKTTLPWWIPLCAVLSLLLLIIVAIVSYKLCKGKGQSLFNDFSVTLIH